MKIHVRVKPNSRHRQEVAKNPDGTYTIYTKAPAVENKANTSAAVLLAEYFDVPKSCVRLSKGATAKYKIFEVSVESDHRKVK